MLDLVHNLGVMSFMTLIVFLIAVRTGWDITSLAGQIGFGLVFAVMALMVVKLPVRLTEGATFDFRAAPAVLSAFFGGPIAGLITATAASVARYQVGGPAALGGAVSPFLYCLAGLLGAWGMRRMRRASAGPLGFLALTALASIVTLPAFFIGMEPSLSFAILAKIWPMFLLGNFIGIVVLGLLIEETLRIRDERASFREASIAATAGLEAKNRFLSAVSHDIRTPLNGIRGALQLLADQMPPQGDRKLIRIAERSARYLEDLVEQILDFAKLQSGTLPNRTKDFTVEQLLDGASSMFAESARDKGLSLHVAIKGNAGQALHDRYDSLRQILFNLIGNAVRYTHQGSITVTASLSPTDATESRLSIDVRDTGPGIAPEDQARIFDQFVRLAPAGVAENGSGLGLSIARSLVDQMGGTLTVNSTPGKGSTFSFRVDVKHAPVRKAEVDNAPRPLAEPDRTALSGRTILVVDDNLLNRDLLSEALRRMGADVLTADCGQAAIQAVKDKASAIDAVLMDIQMPDMQGDEATRILRAEVPAAATMPIVAVTANAFADQRKAYLQAGMTDVVLKPIDFAALTGTLTRLMDGPSTAPLSAGSSAAPGHAQLAVLNRRQIDGLVRYLSEDRVWGLLRNTLDEVDVRLASLEKTAEKPEPTVKRIAHDIKGLSANMGLDQLAHAAAQLEKVSSDQARQAAIEVLNVAARVAREEIERTAPAQG